MQLNFPGGRVKDGFLEEVASNLRPERHVRCLGEEDIVPAFVAFYWMSKYRYMSHHVISAL